jgi:UDP-glucuronate decarboxylase
MNLDDGRVISNFVIQALKNKKITIYGNGEQTRSFCYNEDMVRGLYKLMNREDRFTGLINLGSPYELTVLELAELITTKAQSRSTIVFGNAIQDHP